VEIAPQAIFEGGLLGEVVSDEHDIDEGMIERVLKESPTEPVNDFETVIFSI